MADCSNTHEFLAEWARMCAAQKYQCSSCPIGGVCDNIVKLSAFGQEIVQEWSDKQKPKTYAEVFYSMHKQALKDHDGSPFCCREVIFGTRKTREPCTKKNGCSQCWNEPYKEDE